MERESDIRKIAYELWEKEGKPEGRDMEFYFRAEAIWNESQRSMQTTIGSYVQAKVNSSARSPRKSSRLRKH